MRRAFRLLYPLNTKDVLIDLGSGDGLVLREAAKRGAKAIGYELNPVLTWIARWLSRGNKNITVHIANMWRIAFPRDTTVVYAFVVSRDVRKVAKKIQLETDRLGKPLKFISYGCELPGKTPIKTNGAHFLYDFIPLQKTKT